MAVFTHVSDEAVAGFLKLYGLPEPDMITGIAEGTENTNFKILAGGRRFILTLYEARVNIADLPYFLSLMGEVADAGLPSAKAIQMQTGERLGVLAGRPAALIEFLPGRPNMEPTPEDARKAGAFLARFHDVTKDLSLHRPNDMSLASWRAMIDRAGTKIARFGDDLHAELIETAKLLSDRWPGHAPRGPIHGDLFPDNLLLDHGDVSGVIDFYFACTDFFAYDLSISMNAYTDETGELDLSNATAMRAGYEAVRPLSDEENAALPVFLCGSALRFFLTRATDAIFVQESALYTGKDPLPWLRLMRHHREAMESVR